MNFYDDERMIIEDFQIVYNREVCFPVRSRGAIKAFKAVRNTRKWANWTYSAGKADPPPDFFSDKYHLMMEVMRIDDHAFLNEKGALINPVNMRESKLQKEVRETLKTARPDIDVDKLRIRVNAITNLPSIEDHNYQFYCANFRRALEKHIQKIPLYRSNHPDKKLIFFVFDESTAYTIVDNLEVAQRGFKPGEPFIAKPAFHFLDNRFVNVFRNSDIDYLIWYAPYKIFHGSPAQLPKVCVFDVKRYNYKYSTDYPEELIVSAEA